MCKAAQELLPRNGLVVCFIRLLGVDQHGY
jgi:hypothetical protein